jgi:hypothetical protein
VKNTRKRGPDVETTSPSLGSAPSPTALCVVCHVRLNPPSRVGRPRLTCSTRCRRQRDFRARKIRRRVGWIANWQAELHGRDYPVTFVRKVIRYYRHQIRQLQGQHHEG